MSSYNQIISPAEQAQIQKQVEHVLAPYVKSPNASELIAKWHLNKQRFIGWFHGPIYEYPEKVSIELNDEEKKDLYSRFKSDLEELDILEDYDSWVKQIFIDYFDYISADEFFENKFGHDVTMILYNEDEEEEVFSFKKDAKILKSLNTFDFGEVWRDMIREVQDFASTYIQKAKLTGILCLSVHPLDFLSLSENAENWRSCHALDGEFRAGNLEYIQNRATFVAYIKAPRDKLLPRFPNDLPWNSKKWRTVFYLSNDDSIMFAGRSYPFHSQQALDKVKEVFCMLAGKGSSFWYDKYAIINTGENPPENNYWINKSIIVGCDIFPIKTLFGEEGGKISMKENPREPLFYNDVLLSNRYTPSYTYLTSAYFTWGQPRSKSMNDIMFYNSSRSDRTFFESESPVHCLHCLNHFIEGSDTFVCPECLGNEEGTTAYSDRHHTHGHTYSLAVDGEDNNNNNNNELYF